MTKRTRYFLMGSVAFLTVGLVAGLVAYFGGIPGALAQAGPNELRYVPEDAVVVAYADVHDLMNSQFRQQVKAFEPNETSHGQNEFHEATGIDIERDVDYVVACLLPGQTPAAGKEKSGFVIAKGRFDRGRIESYIASHGGSSQEYRGKKLYLPPVHETASDISEHTGGHHEGALAFLDNEVVAFGSDGGVKRAIDLQFGGNNVSANAELYRMIKNVDGGNAWAVGRFDVLTKNATLPEELASRIPPITWFSATGHVNGGVSGTLSVEAKDPAAAENLKQVVQGFMALARLQAGSNAKQPEMATMLNSIQLSGTGNTVAVSFSVPAEALELLKQKR